jgi:hypothetical protein
MTKKKLRGTRPRLTHFEIRRGSTLRLRLSIADDALAGAGDELGALIKKIAPNAVSTSVIAPVAPIPPAPIMSAPPPAPETGMIKVTSVSHDDEYHACLRERLTTMFSSLCDASLADALEIAGQERARRAEGGN